MVNKYSEFSKAKKRKFGNCVTKSTFNKLEKARRYAKQYGEKYGEPMEAYMCPICRKYHLTRIK